MVYDKFICTCHSVISCSGKITCDLAPIDFGSGAPDLGILMQSSDDDKDWEIINKKTPNKATGPTADHSTGKGYYAYLEASGIYIGSRVIKSLH